MGKQREEGLTSKDTQRLALKIWGPEIFENGHFYPCRSSEIEQIYEELVKELKADLRSRDRTIARLARERLKRPSKTRK